MSLAEISIRRPVLAIVLSLVIVLLGALSVTRLGVREYPAVDPPIVSIVTTYPGASAEIIESQITEPIEAAVNAVAGIRAITSTSREGASQVTVEFTLNTDLEAAANDVRDKLGAAVRNLPTDANPPVVEKADADASPFFGIVISSPTRDLMPLTAYGETLRERLQTVQGVSNIRLAGEKRYSMRLWLDPARLAAHGLTALDVRQALQRESVELPSGRIEGGAVELTVRTLSRLSTVEEFNLSVCLTTTGLRVGVVQKRSAPAQVCAIQRQIAHAVAGGGKNSVRESRGHGWDHRFTQTRGRIIGDQKMRLDHLGCLSEP